MAWSDKTRTTARTQYVYDRRNLTEIGRRLKVNVTTITRWKRQAKEAGDDWDKARVANSVAGEGAQAVAVQFMEDFMLLLQATVEDVKNPKTKMEPQQRVDALARLADAYNKAMAAVKRTMPELSELAVSMEVLQALAKFVQAKYPQHAKAFSEILEPFGQELAKRYG
jgi:uncharacterized protein YjcR